MEREFGFTQSDFNKVRTILVGLTGINLADSKESLVYSRLAPRVRKLGLKNTKEYLKYLEDNLEEQENFINALTTNLTSFYREPHHFSILAQYINQGESVKRIWCAASSTGEEPYSIAMSLVKAYGRFDHNVEIIASDIDSKVLETANTGKYPLEKVEALPDKKSFFVKGKGNNLGFAKVVPELRNMIEFIRVNLLDENLPIEPNLDVIFCRNVMIYFDKDTQAKILTKLLAKLRPGGLYIAGHSENFSHFSNVIKPIGRTAYIKL
ncbi:chemotaxis protein CheR [Marinomonas rhizomae]|uniref:CheR family methyltransferase n=1 Tax=Marinomonas rhizomae TaxID=491948 RepID=UPI002103ADE5|nr:CheR family methyltransferase [Marinomonas rhizomae]UTV98556.1 chemotaxis protein CheR [Marinomonas rhizomae]